MIRIPPVVNTTGDCKVTDNRFVYDGRKGLAQLNQLVDHLVPGEWLKPHGLCPLSGRPERRNAPFEVAGIRGNPARHLRRPLLLVDIAIFAPRQDRPSRSRQYCERDSFWNYNRNYNQARCEGSGDRTMSI
jgi:hypothetical protein